MSVSEIRDAIIAEIEATPSYYDFKVVHSEKDGALWKIQVDTSLVFTESGVANLVLDESLEGAASWWAGRPNGTGDVLSVIPDEELIIIRYASSLPASRGGTLRIYPPRYLDKLLSIWSNPILGKSFYASRAEILDVKVIDRKPLQFANFSWLRNGQKEAFQLVCFRDGFLHGPPGTGKTTTLGALLAEFVITSPKSKILLLSTTNYATDQALVSVDKALENCKRDDLRHKVFRIGSRFIASYYEGREHLLPVSNKSLVIALSKLEGSRPDPTDIHAYSLWKSKIEKLRQDIRNESRNIMHRAQVIGMTTTRAVFDFDELQLLGKFDLVVFDEASQIGLAHALALAPLGRSRIFAGDPNQLSPIVQSKKIQSQKWLGKSPFTLKSSRNSVILNEQSRMAESICEVVSQVFYAGKLVVAKDVKNNSHWKKERDIKFGNNTFSSNVVINNVSQEGLWSAKYKGPIRFESANSLVDLLDDGIKSKYFSEDDVIVLTPFRAQRSLIKSLMFHKGLKKIKVSTVHRSQGSESLLVIFDPVQASNNFLKGEEARRLVNVALSRAKGKLVIFLSEGDVGNEIFREINNIITLSKSTEKPISICNYMKNKDFPWCAIGKTVQIKNNFGKVISTPENGNKLVLLNAKTGKEQVFIVEFMKSLCESGS